MSPDLFYRIKNVHPGSIRRECKYANNYSAHGTNTNVEEERVHMALFRGHSNDGGVPGLTDRKNSLKESREKRRTVEKEDVQESAQRHTV